MKNSIKRIFTIVMALAVLFSLSVSVFAASTPEATIDYSRKGSISLYKYDMTSAAEDGAWNTESYVSTGLADDSVEQALNPYAVRGVEFSYLRVADITTFSGLVDGESVTKVLYGVPGNEQDIVVVHKNIYQFFNEMLSQFRVLAGFLTAMLFYNINYFAYFSDHP